MIRAPDPAERSAVDQWVATPPEDSLRRVTAVEDRHPMGLDPPRTGDRVEVEKPRREHRREVTVPERTLERGCPDGSIYLSSGLARREVERRAFDRSDV